VDVLVVGGGVSGIPAAIAAARTGADTLVVEREGWLGGYFDSGWGAAVPGLAFQDTSGEQVIKGIAWEIVERLSEQGGALLPVERRFLRNTWPIDGPYSSWKAIVDQELGKALAFEMTEEAGVRLLLHTWATDVIVEGDTVKGIVVENKSGRQAIMAKAIVDCTGDGDIAARAGAPFEQTSKEEVYQVSRGFRLANVDTERVRQYILDHVDDYAFVVEPVDVPEGYQKPIMAQNYKASDLEISEDGRVLRGGPGSHGSMSVGMQTGVAGVGATADGIDGTDAWELTRAEVEIRRKAVQNWRRLRAQVPGYENSWLMTGPLGLGVRESRRIVGGHTLTAVDMAEGRRFDDAIAQSAMTLDAHKQKSEWMGTLPRHTYDLPYRMLVPQGVEGLLVAGRCSSMDHDAEAGLRKIPVCMALGQAAGTAAALAAQAGVAPRALDIAALQRTLLAQDVPLRKDLAEKLSK
jgi:hypothetical protein